MAQAAGWGRLAERDSARRQRFPFPPAQRFPSPSAQSLPFPSAQSFPFLPAQRFPSPSDSPHPASPTGA